MNMEQMTDETITVTLGHGDRLHTISCPTGTLVGRLIEMDDVPGAAWPYIGASVNNDVVSLSYPLEVDCRVRLLTLADSSGWRIYRSSVTFLLAKAAHAVFPDAEMRVEHSLDTGFYCSFTRADGTGRISLAELQKIENSMREMVAAEIPIVRRKIFFADALRHFEERGQQDKYNLLRFRNPPKVVVYQCRDFIDLAHGPLADNTRALGCFRLAPYEPGFVVQFADRSNPPNVLPFEKQPAVFRVFQTHKKWGKTVGVRTVGDLNELIMRDEIKSYIRTEEAFQEKQVARIADTIADRRALVNWVLIAGPSSSGKTTFAKRLSDQLRVNGINTRLISMDNYFVERDRTPRDETGAYDFEHIEALDLPLFHQHLQELDAGHEVLLPHFDFHSGMRRYNDEKMRIEKDQVVLIEGIHSLNPRLTATISAEKKFRIYISALTQLTLDLNNRISTTDNRLIRRMVRDHRFRGHSAVRTLEMWSSVRAGEKRWIFPFQEEADVAFNSALGYELAVLKTYVEPLLSEVKPFHPQYADARRLQSFLKSFIDVPAVSVPPTSIVREFIGSSGFRY
jgi:uridine kinase